MRADNGVHAVVVRVGLAVDETTPGLVAFVDDLGGVLLVLGLAGESERVLGLAIGCSAISTPIRLRQRLRTDLVDSAMWRKHSGGRSARRKSRA